MYVAPNEEAAKAAMTEFERLSGHTLAWDDLAESSKNLWRMVTDAALAAWHSANGSSSC